MKRARQDDDGPVVPESATAATDNDALILEAAVNGVSFDVFGAAAAASAARFGAMLYGDNSLPLPDLLRNTAFSARGAPFSDAEDDALAANAALPAPLPLAELLRTRRAVFHYARTVAELESRRDSGHTTMETRPTLHSEWPPTALARIRGVVVSHWMVTRDVLLGRGNKCDVNLFLEVPSLVCSRRAAVLLADSQGMWLRNVGAAPCCDGTSGVPLTARARVFTQGAILCLWISSRCCRAPVRDWAPSARLTWAERVCSSRATWPSFPHRSREPVTTDLYR